MKNNNSVKSYTNKPEYSPLDVDRRMQTEVKYGGRNKKHQILTVL